HDRAPGRHRAELGRPFDRPLGRRHADRRHDRLPGGPVQRPDTAQRPAASRRGVLARSGDAAASPELRRDRSALLDRGADGLDDDERLRRAVLHGGLRGSDDRRGRGARPASLNAQRTAGMHIRPVTRGDRDEWLRMRLTRYPASTPDEVDEWLDSADQGTLRVGVAVFVADRGDGRLAGFAEIGLRSYAEGCLSTPVAFLEGWYVDPDV